jgi:anti-sigma B factor antagonist
VTATSVEPSTTDLVTVEVAPTESGVRVIAAGEIDSTSAPVLREQLESILGTEAGEIVVDLVQVTFLDSAGLCVLAAAHRRAVSQGVRLQVVAASRAVIRPLQITGLWALLGARQVELDSGAA